MRWKPSWRAPTLTAAQLTENEITGLVIATMFAGHHTSSGTATWTLTELARQKEYSAEVSEELQALFKRQ